MNTPTRRLGDDEGDFDDLEDADDPDEDEDDEENDEDEDGDPEEETWQVGRQECATMDASLLDFDRRTCLD
jgi:hypothetical protein